MRVIDKAKEQLADAEFEAVEGDARNVLCEAVDRHAADLLVVGSHGYGAIKRHYSLLLISTSACVRFFSVIHHPPNMTNIAIPPRSISGLSSGASATTASTTRTAPS
jgi:hypothetical protein